MRFLFLILAATLSSALANRTFPDNFKLGVATASYQIEGAWNEDGKGLSMWDNFVRVPGHIANNDTGDVACDSYHKYKEDVALMKQLGIQMYRYSISWPRILPDGTPHNINQAGIDYYVNLTKELVANGIEPMVTLYHWDLPQYLEDLGGWLNPEIANYFGDFARIVYSNLGQYVKYWITINEPSSTCVQGYNTGSVAPGKALKGEGIYQCAYNHIRAHAKAYRIYDEEFRAQQGGKVTINNPIFRFYPKSNNTEDQDAAKRAHEFSTGLYLNPIYLGDWPAVVKERVDTFSTDQGYSFSRLPKFTQEEIDYINGTHDYFALNVYTSFLIENIQHQIGAESSYEDDMGGVQSSNTSLPKSASSWLYFDPKCMREVLNLVQDEYKPNEIIITENGWSDTGELEDDARITYYQGYLGNLLDAIYEDGINVVGYTLWSLLDNFEWTRGYTEKFGIVKVDFDSPNRTRTLKKSAEWYKNVIATRTLS